MPREEEDAASLRVRGTRAVLAVELDAGEHPHEAGYLKLDISKVRGRLQWNPALRLEDALNLVTDWAVEYKKGADARELTLKQLEHYQKATQI